MATRVLIVDDNRNNLYLLESLLTGYDFEVISAENGQEALDKGRRTPPDLIVSDILMPVMDGYALCREWKSDDILKQIPLVFYTATYTESKDKAFALSLGADRFIIKPQEPDILMKILQEVLEEGGTLEPAARKPLGEDMEFFRQYNEILFKKLEKKISDLETANRQLRILEEQYRLNFENITDVVFTIDADLNISNITPSVERVLGYRPQDFIGRPASGLGYVFTPESYEQALANIRLILKGEVVEPQTYRFIAGDGNIKYGEVSSSPITRDGRIIGAVSVARDITERKQAEDKIKASLIEKETMLREIHHRVKNNLQVISSLLGLQSSYLQDEKAREMFQNSIDRVKSMAMIHTQLYQSADLSRVNFGVFISDLAGRLQQSYGISEAPIAFHVDVADVFLTIDTSIPCGLILNELVSNALKHAFPAGRGGEVNIGMTVIEDRLVLTVQDNGIGFPSSIDFRDSRSLGLELVNILVNQVNGAIDLKVDGGTKFTITFPASDRKGKTDGKKEDHGR